ncbi:MAG: ABC transporter permease [Leadbetterella sp.]|nr:ABC transporter permease [Leadbetterella sp.]
MIRNYFKTAWRNLLRNKSFALINILGLASGLTCCLLLTLYLQHELSYDRFHTKGDRIVRVIMEYKIGDSGNKGNFTSTKVFPEFRRQFPEVVSGVRMSMLGLDRIVKYGDRVGLEEGVLHADSTFFELFDFKLLSGKASDVLKGPNRVVLSRSMAEKYFGKEEPVGKTLLLNSNQQPYQVTGVSEDCPSNSQIRYSMVASMSSFGPLQEKTYSNANYVTYLLMDRPESLNSLQGKIDRFMKKENADAEFKVSFELEPFTRIHLHSPYDAYTPNINISYIYIIAGVALLILLIACFTYINLSTARSTERAREVGIRKVAGAWRSQLFWQFISESGILTLLALAVSFLLAIALLPAFNNLAGTALSYADLGHPAVWGAATLAALTVALLAGSYPALILSSFQPVKVLKGAFKNTGSGNALRKGLIVFQFVISVFLIISTFIISSQLRYIQQKKLGYDRENRVLLGMDQSLNQKRELVKSELNSLAAVSGVSLAYETPVTIRGGYNMSGSDLSQTMAVTANPVDEDFLKVTGLELIAGSDLRTQDIRDVNKEDYTQNYFHFILNESAARALGWNPQEAIGKKMYLDEYRPGEVKGVVKDFHFESLHAPIKPLVLFPSAYANTAIVKIQGQHVGETLAALEAKWKELAPHRPFTFRFMDEDYQKMYEAEVRTGRVFNIFASLAVVLACLGLFGLSAYAVRQRVKEVGVRKVLGASGLQIVTLLSSGFVKLVIIAFVIAGPLAWLVMNKWLQQFSYRVETSWWIFAAAGAVALLLALVTVSFQAIKAAMTSPVKSLRTE